MKLYFQALMIFFFLVVPIVSMAQEKSGDSIVAYDSAVVHDSIQVVDAWKSGVRFLSVQGVFLMSRGEIDRNLAVDLDGLYTDSEFRYGLGLRAGWHNAFSIAIYDYGFNDNRFDLLARFSAVSRILRFDIYYGYRHTLHEYSGFFDPVPGIHHETIDEFDFGAEFRVYLIPDVAGLIIRGEYQDIIGRKRPRGLFGLGLVACWQP
ncbi:MAG: hypothetical protein ABI876_10595 [Bacteroidota bacterium]